MALAEEESLRIQQAQKGVTTQESILEGLEAELALERELGVRVIECDRSLLVVNLAPPVPSAATRPPPAPVHAPPAVVQIQAHRAPPQPPHPSAPAVSGALLDIVFLHDSPLAPAGAEMMAKIVAALGKAPEAAPVVYEAPIPRAKVYVVLGRLALKKWFPAVKAAPGQWVATELSQNVLVTYSPTYILRFAAAAPAVQQIKKSMWTSLKAVLQRI
jgi:hypothetical protein